MQSKAAAMPFNRQELLLAYRWPAAVVLSSLALSAVLLKVLSEPIPVRIDGGLQVDKLVMPASPHSQRPTPPGVRNGGGGRPRDDHWSATTRHRPRQGSVH